MENKASRITDIAQALGVSTTTVHKVIYNKKGVGEETRQRILTYLQEQDFQINRAASALKRRAVRLAYVGIEPAEYDRFYYQELRTGVEKAYENYQGHNLSLEWYCSEDNVEAQITLLEKIYEERREALDGLILNCVHEFLLSPIIDRLSSAGVKVVTLNSDARNSARSAYICANSTMAGQVAGELLLSFGIPDNSQVLLIGGYRDYTHHRLAFSGCAQWLKQERPDIDILDMYQSEDSRSTEEKIKKYLLAFPDIRGIYCVTARGTLSMCRSIQELGLSRKYKTVGTDVFQALAPFFQDQTLTASIFQNPRRQGERALSSLYGLVIGEHPVPELQIEDISIAIRTNAESFYPKE